jgi:hypothetical protein
MTKQISNENSEAGKILEFTSESLEPGIPLQPLDLLNCRLGDEAGEETRSIQPRARIGRPRDWFQTLRDTTHWYDFSVYRPEGDEYYIVSPQMSANFGGLAVRHKLVPWISTEGIVSFWPMNRGVHSESLAWLTSAWEIALQARKEWRMLVSNRKAQMYTAKEPVKPGPSPVWPPNDELMRLMTDSFEGRIITDTSHSAFRKFQMA